MLLQSEELLPESNPAGGFLIVLERGLEYHADDDIFFVCIQTKPGGPFIHQGDAKNVKIVVKRDHIPGWLKIIAIIVCLLLSGTFSGLNLGLMSLDQTELKIVMSTGTDKEKSYAKVHTVISLKVVSPDNGRIPLSISSSCVWQLCV